VHQPSDPCILDKQSEEDRSHGPLHAAAQQLAGAAMQQQAEGRGTTLRGGSGATTSTAHPHLTRVALLVDMVNDAYSMPTKERWRSIERSNGRIRGR
jgi:hypothetical protein